MRYLYIHILLVACYLLPVVCTAQIITTVAGNGTQGYSGDGGQATNAELFNPAEVILDAAGNMYIADDQNNRIRKINTAGIITTIAGNGTGGYSGDGGQATAAELYDPTGLCFDTAGNLYIAEYGNSRIRMINTNEIISTVAGDGAFGFSGDGGQATNAECNSPEGVAFDTHGNLYIADFYNNCIRMVNTAGIISTVAGTGTAGYSGDGGQATGATLYRPAEIAFDTNGNMYIADEYNNRIRKVNTAGIISTIVGTGIGGYNGDGIQATTAELYYPSGLCLDAAGNLYIADSENNRIRMVTIAGIISTIVGNGIAGYSGDGGNATAAELYDPCRVTLDATGNIYICDEKNNLIRKVNNIGQAGIPQFGIQNSEFKIYPNPTTTILNVVLRQAQDDNAILVITDMLGNNIKQIPFNTQQVILNLGDLADGIYFITIETERGKTIKKIIKQ